jgi:hypothetical protein
LASYFSKIAPYSYQYWPPAKMKDHVLPNSFHGLHPVYTGLVSPNITRWQHFLSSSLDLVPRHIIAPLLHTQACLHWQKVCSTLPPSFEYFPQVLGIIPKSMKHCVFFQSFGYYIKQ